MIKKCNTCGMLRSSKDLVLFEDGSYMCFSCWNQYNRKEGEKYKKESI